MTAQDGIIREVGLRYIGRGRKLPCGGESVTGPADAWRVARAFGMLDAPVEQFAVLLLDGRNHVTGFVRVSQGTLTASLVHPREVFAPALHACAQAIILIHNHPSGDPTPSSEDRAITARLVECGALLGIAVLDHVVIANKGWVSLADLGAIKPSPA